MKMETKRKCFKIICFCMAAIMIVTCFAPLTSYAAETGPFLVTGEYNGNFSLSTTEESLFNISNAAPGNVYKGVITVKNNGPDKMDIAIIDIASNIEDESLYDNLVLKISKDGVVLYSGIYGNTPDPVTSYFAINPRSSIDFVIEVSFPEHSDNAFQAKKLSTIWTFEGMYHNKERVQTGHELTSSNPMDTVLPVIIVGAVISIILSAGLIMYFRKKEKNEEVEGE